MSFLVAECRSNWKRGVERLCELAERLGEPVGKLECNTRLEPGGGKGEANGTRWLAWRAEKAIGLDRGHSRRAEKAWGASLAWRRLTSILGNVSESGAGCSCSLGTGKAHPIQEGTCCSPTRGQQAITLNLPEMGSQLLPFLVVLTVKAVSRLFLSLRQTCFLQLAPTGPDFTLCSSAEYIFKGFKAVPFHRGQ